MPGEDLKAIAFHLADGGGHDIDHTSINENTSFYDFHRVVCKLKYRSVCHNGNHSYTGENIPQKL